MLTDVTTIEARNKANYLAAKQAFNDNDMTACLAFYAQSHQVRSSPSPPGRAAIAAFLSGVHAMWPGIQLVVEHVVAEGEFVMGRSRASAIHSATVFGVAPTQRKIETTFWDLHRFDADGIIVETWNLMDGLAILAQLGRLPNAG